MNAERWYKVILGLAAISTAAVAAIVAVRIIESPHQQIIDNERRSRELKQETLRGL